MRRKRAIKAPKNLNKAETQVVSKHKRLIAAIIKRIVMFALLIAALAAVMMFLQGKKDDAEKKLSAVQSKVRTVTSQNTNLVQQIDNLGSAAQVYTDLAENRENMEFQIDPLELRPLLENLKTKFHITTLNLQVSSKERLELKNVLLDGAAATKFEASINLASMSDHFVYGFVDELTRNMPGIVHIESIRLERTQPMSIEVLSRISRGQKVETLNAIITLSWYGFVQEAESANKENGA